MQVDYRKKILKEIEKVPDEKLANMYRIIQSVDRRAYGRDEKDRQTGFLKGDLERKSD